MPIIKIILSLYNEYKYDKLNKKIVLLFIAKMCTDITKKNNT